MTTIKFSDLDGIKTLTVNRIPCPCARIASIREVKPGRIEGTTTSGEHFAIWGGKHGGGAAAQWFVQSDTLTDAQVQYCGGPVFALRILAAA